MPSHNIWIAIADGAKANIVEYNGPAQPLTLVKDGALDHINQPTRELVTNKRGSVFHSADEGRSAMEPRTDAHEHEKEVFAREIGAFLKAHNDEFGSIIVAAAPRMLGYLRDTLPNSVKRKVTAEIDKDLSHLPFTALPKHLQSVLRI